MELHTEMSVQLKTELIAEADSSVRNAIEAWLAPVFTDKAKDVDLRFFTDETDEMAHQIREEINDNRTSYTIYLPKENYMHLAVANIADNRQVQLSEGEHSTTMRLAMPQTRDVPSLNTGIFTARLPMMVNDSTNQVFEVHLYMVTAAVVLVLDPGSCPDLVSVSGLMHGAADEFLVRDSSFTYSAQASIMMDNIPVKKSAPAIQRHLTADNERLCLGAVSLPTEDNKNWKIVATATLTNNRHTTTTLTVNEPLQAGTLRILQCKVYDNGEIQPVSKTGVGASVELDWDEGTVIDIEM